MHLGIYRFDGDPDELLTAYERLMETIPPGNVGVHLCAVRPDGITLFDTCPSQAVFERFTSDPALQQAFTAAGLPRPAIDDLPVYVARGPGGTVLGGSRDAGG